MPLFVKSTMVVLIMLVFGIAAFYNIKWIKKYKKSNVFTWVKMGNAFVSVLWVIFLGYALLGYLKIIANYNQEWFSEFIFRPLNLLTGVMLAAGSIVRMRIAEYIVDNGKESREPSGPG